MSSHGPDPVKVRVIVTRFVQTDEAHFKSIVQTLTGKDSVVAMEPEAVRQRTADRGRRLQRAGGDNSGGRGPGNPAAARQGDLDRMIMELPSVLEELRELLAD